MAELYLGNIKGDPSPNTVDGSLVIDNNGIRLATGTGGHVGSLEHLADTVTADESLSGDTSSNIKPPSFTFPAGSVVSVGAQVPNGTGLWICLGMRVINHGYYETGRRPVGKCGFQVSYRNTWTRNILAQRVA